VLFVIYSWLFGNRMMRIMFELKREELGGEGCVMWSFIIYTACEVVGNERTVTEWVRNVACMGLKVMLNRLLIGKRGGNGPFRRSV